MHGLKEMLDEGLSLSNRRITGTELITCTDITILRHFLCLVIYNTMLVYTRKSLYRLIAHKPNLTFKNVFKFFTVLSFVTIFLLTGFLYFRLLFSLVVILIRRVHRLQAHSLNLYTIHTLNTPPVYAYSI